MMEIYNIHFKSDKDKIILTFSNDEIEKEDVEEDVIGTIAGNDLIDAKRRIAKLLEKQLR